jgi:hypothetical protein
MALTRFAIEHREPYREAMRFGDTGAYELLEGVAHFEVNPREGANRGIIDLHNAPMLDNGNVAFSAKLATLVPVDRTRRDKLLIDVPNRGRRLAFGFNRVPRDQALQDPLAPGDGFLFRHGFTLATVGWQWDVGEDEGFWLDAPIARENGAPIRGEVICRLQPATTVRSLHIGQLGRACYRPTDPEGSAARLFEHDHEAAPLIEIPRSEWRFARERDDGVRPSLSHIFREAGFEAGRHYVLIYEAEDPRVAGVGLLAVRDVAVAMREGSLLPDGTAYEFIYGYGASQTGRFLRHFLYEGRNEGEGGQRAFDGLLPHIAGSQRLDVNHRFAQPSSPGAPGPNRLFPFAAARTRDPLSGREDGLLERAKASDTAPRVILTNTSWEYWRGDASLIHTLPDGSADAPEEDQVRIYLFAGAQHIAGSLPQVDTNPLLGIHGRYGFGIVDHSPLLRATLLNLDAWVREGIEPPPSTPPRLADGTAVSRGEVLEAFAALPDMQLLDPEQLSTVRDVNPGPDFERGIVRYPLDAGEVRPTYVSRIDTDFNEVAGIKLPDISVPVGSHSGWNPRHPDIGAPGQAVNFMGFTRFFPATEAQRERVEDPRAAVESRYADRDEYLGRVRQAALALAEQRYLLAEDVDHVVENSAARYDAVTASDEQPVAAS